MDDVYYMSFADSNLPKGQQWLGGMFVYATNVSEALVRLTLSRQNPGGEIAFTRGLDSELIKPDYFNKLLKTEKDVYDARL